MDKKFIDYIYKNIKGKDSSLPLNIVAYTLNNPSKPRKKINFVTEAFLLHLNCLKASQTYRQHNYADFNILTSNNQITSPFPCHYIKDINYHIRSKFIECTNRILLNKQDKRYIYSEMRNLIENKNLLIYRPKFRLTEKIGTITELMKLSTDDKMMVVYDPQTRYNRMIESTRNLTYTPPTKRLNLRT